VRRRGHTYPDRFKVWITGQVRRVTRAIRREMRREWFAPGTRLVVAMAPELTIGLVRPSPARSSASRS
jgi:hypothetical protein